MGCFAIWWRWWADSWCLCVRCPSIGKPGKIFRFCPSFGTQSRTEILLFVKPSSSSFFYPFASPVRLLIFLVFVWLHQNPTQKNSYISRKKLLRRWSRKKSLQKPPWKTQKKVLSFLCCVRACCVARASCRVPLLKYVTAEWKCSQLFYHLSFSLCAWRIALCSFHHSRAGQGRRDVFHLTNFFPACCNGNIKARFFIIIIIICFPFLCPPCPLYHHSC